MNGRLVVALSMFGLAMGVASVAVIPPDVEPLGWLAVFIVCAYLIAKKSPRRRFVTGLLVGLSNAVWVTGAHIAFATTYLAHHPREAAMMAHTPLPNAPRLMMLVTGPVVGLVSGVILGGLALLAGKFVKPPA